MLARKISTASKKLFDIRSYITGNTPLVVLYHRVENLSSDPQMLAVSPENFDGQLRLFKEEFDLLTTAEFSEGFVRRKLPKRALLLTFDDGYADNHYNARPILESHAAEALFFITTGLIGTDRELWWDELERILLVPDTLPTELRFRDKEREYSFSTSDAAARSRAYGDLHPILKYQTPSTRERILDDLRQWAGLDAGGRPSHRLMNWDELKAFSLSRSVVIGAHTINHPPLSILDEASQREEIAGSRVELETAIGKSISYFSYPFGIKRDYNKSSIAICDELGFKMVFANVPGYVRANSNRFEVPRVLVRNWTRNETKSQLKKFQG